MFAFLMSDVMDPFYKNIVSFPTLVLTFFLFLCLFYWLIAIFGLVDFDFLDIDIPDADGDINSGGEDVGLLGGILLKLGLNGVPFPIVFSILIAIAWFLCYYAVYFIFPFIPGRIFEIIAGIPILLASLYFSSLTTSRIIIPMRSFFLAANQEVEKVILGKVAIVRTKRVDKEFGEAKLDDGGAGLIVKVRSFNDNSYARGDRVVLLEHLKEKNLYKVVSEKEFNESE